MRRQFLKIYFAIFFLTTSTLFGQSHENLKLPEPKRLIDKVEFFGSIGFHFPNDNGWYDKINRESQGLIAGEFKKKVGYLAGLGITHSIGRKLEINGRLAWDRKGYLQENVTLDNDNIFKYTAKAQNEYLTGILAPDFFVSKKSRFYISTGIFYSHLLKSFIQETSYFNNRVTQRSSITNSPEINKFDSGVLFAIGYIFPLDSKYNLCLRLQGDFGMSDIVNTNGLNVNANSLKLFIILKHDKFNSIKRH